MECRERTLKSFRCSRPCKQGIPQGRTSSPKKGLHEGCEQYAAEFKDEYEEILCGSIASDLKKVEQSFQLLSVIGEQNVLFLRGIE